MPLVDLDISGTLVNDLSALSDVPIEILAINDTNVSNLKPLLEKDYLGLL